MLDEYVRKEHLYGWTYELRKTFLSILARAEISRPFHGWIDTSRVLETARGVPCSSSDGTGRLSAARTDRLDAQMHLRSCFAVTLSAHVEEMSRGPHCRLVGAHFEEQVEPQIASGRLELVVALIVG